MYSRMSDDPILPQDKGSFATEYEKQSKQKSDQQQQPTLVIKQDQLDQLKQQSQGQPVIIIQYENSRSDMSRYNSRAATALGVCQIVFAVVLLIVNIIAIVYTVHESFVGVGIWTSPMFIVTGSLQIAAAVRYKTFCLIVSVMVLSIISTVFAGIAIIVGSVGFAHMYSRYYYSRGNLEVAMAYHICLVVFGLLLFIICIASAVLCCLPTCCPKKGSQTSQAQETPRVMYVPSSGDNKTGASPVAARPISSMEKPEMVIQPGGYNV